MTLHDSLCVLELLLMLFPAPGDQDSTAAPVCFQLPLLLPIKCGTGLGEGKKSSLALLWPALEVTCLRKMPVATYMKLSVMKCPRGF